MSAGAGVAGVGDGLLLATGAGLGAGVVGGVVEAGVVGAGGTISLSRQHVEEALGAVPTNGAASGPTQ